MASSWWTRRASASDRSSTAPPRTTIRAARSFDPPASSNHASSSTLPQIQQHPPATRSRTTSSSDGRTLTVIANALGFSSATLGKSKSRELLRTGTTSTPESSSRRLGLGSTPPSLINAASVFAAGAATAPLRRAPKSSVGETSRIPKSSSNRQTVVSTESGSSWGAASSTEPYEPTASSWEPTTPSSGSEPKHSFQSMGMVVGEDPFARSPVWVASGSNETGAKSRKKEKERERQPYPERTRRLGVSAGSDVGEDGTVSPLNRSPRSATLSALPESTSMLPRRAASALGPSGSLAPRPVVTVRSHSANSPGAQYIPLPGGASSGYVSSPLPTTPTTPGSQPLTPNSPQPTPPISPRTHTSQLPTLSTRPSQRPQPHRIPSLHIPTVSALEMHAHASAAQTYSPHSQSEFGSEGSPGSFISPIDEIGLAMSGMDVGEMGELPRERMALDEPRAATVDGYMMRRGHSAHAVLSHATNGSSLSKPALGNGSTKPLAVNGSAKTPLTNGSTKPSLGVGVGRAGMGIGGVVGMGSMTALASGIVTGLGEESAGSAGEGSGNGVARGPPKRPSRSELRER